MFQADTRKALPAESSETAKKDADQALGNRLVREVPENSRGMTIPPEQQCKPEFVGRMHHQLNSAALVSTTLEKIPRLAGAEATTTSLGQGLQIQRETVANALDRVGDVLCLFWVYLMALLAAGSREVTPTPGVPNAGSLGPNGAFRLVSCSLVSC